jgi:hypothetical protein
LAQFCSFPRQQRFFKVGLTSISVSMRLAQM